VSEALALELDEVSAGYGETVVLEKVQLALKDGETLSIIGRNGVGKTTLLATIMGHTTLHGGRLRLQGKDIAYLAPYRRALAGLGYVPQEREIFPSLTLRENLEVAARPGRWTIEEVFALFPKRARPIAATSSPAASSRCWRSAARWWATRRWF
jgi:branched-chain amino acid transport system ATP-binding protein